MEVQNMKDQLDLQTICDVKKVLLDSANLIETQGHCKGAYARNSKGTSVEYDSYHAASFCVLGAMMKTCADVNVFTATRIILSDSVANGSSVSRWNDSHEAEEVVAALREVANALHTKE